MFRAQLIAFGVLSTMVSFYVFLVVLATVSSGFGQDNDNEPSCASVKTAYRQKRLTDSDVPQWAVRGIQCCTKCAIPTLRLLYKYVVVSDHSQ